MEHGRFQRFQSPDRRQRQGPSHGRSDHGRPAPIQQIPRVVSQMPAANRQHLSHQFAPVNVRAQQQRTLARQLQVPQPSRQELKDCNSLMRSLHHIVRRTPQSNVKPSSLIDRILLQDSLTQEVRMVMSQRAIDCWGTQPRVDNYTVRGVHGMSVPRPLDPDYNQIRGFVNLMTGQTSVGPGPPEMLVSLGKPTMLRNLTEGLAG